MTEAELTYVLGSRTLPLYESLESLIENSNPFIQRIFDEEFNAIGIRSKVHLLVPEEPIKFNYDGRYSYVGKSDDGEYEIELNIPPEGIKPSENWLSYIKLFRLDQLSPLEQVRYVIRHALMFIKLKGCEIGEIPLFGLAYKQIVSEAAHIYAMAGINKSQ